MTNKATRDKIKQACRLYSEFGVEKSRLICKICKTNISMTSRTKMIELEEHFKTIQHLKSVGIGDNLEDIPGCSETTSSGNNSSNEVSSGNDSDSNVNSVFPSVSSGSIGSKNSSVKIEIDDDIRCEYENLKSFNRPIKQELDTIVCGDFLPANQLFYTDLIQLCLTTNISFTKLTGPEFRSFFHKHFNKPIPSWDEIRTQFLKPMYEKKICKLKELVSPHNIYIIVKQHWCDGRGNVVTLMVGVLDGKPSKSHLYKVSVMKNVDLTTLSQEIIAILHNLYQGLAFDKLSLLVTDNCPLSVQIGNFLKTLFPKLRHVVCLIISLDSYCEIFRSQHKLLSEYVSVVNAIFDSSPNLSAQFKNKMSKSIEFPLGHPNLFGAQWMEAVETLCTEFPLLASIVDTALTDSKIDIVLKEKIDRLSLLFENKELQEELIDYSGYRCLRETIKLLGTNIYNLPQIKRRVEELGRRPKRSALIKLVKDSMWKNPDLELILNLAEDLNSSDEGGSNNIFMYAPLCVTDSFKCFKLFQSMLEENGEIEDQDLETLTFLAYNKDL